MSESQPRHSIREWWVPVNAHPQAVRPRFVGETRPVEPTEAREFLPVLHLAPRMLWPNAFEVKIEDARHYTSLRFPA